MYIMESVIFLQKKAFFFDHEKDFHNQEIFCGKNITRWN